MAFEWNEVSRYAKIQRISWKFIPPTAAWWGGFWERIVRTLKELLRRTLGDIVLIGDDVKKRLQWPLVRVIELIPGKNGLGRTVRVKTQHSILVRPIQQIFPLEASGSDFQGLLNPLADSSMKTLDNDVNLP
ncbi:uncharacterized protein TNCV_919061 [Trichonephila clavipes]|nr:uncharacterized protein TNCV_919061 [Trichonephila clavipes]